jgi:hypothetical protein
MTEELPKALELVTAARLPVYSDTIRDIVIAAFPSKHCAWRLPIINLVLSGEANLDVSVYGRAFALLHRSRGKTLNSSSLQYLGQALFERMRNAGVKPDSHVFANMMALSLPGDGQTYCEGKQQENQVLELAKSMLKYQVPLDIRHRSRLCQVLARTGKETVALRVLEESSQAGMGITELACFDLLQSLQQPCYLDELLVVVNDMRRRGKRIPERTLNFVANSALNLAQGQKLLDLARTIPDNSVGTSTAAIIATFMLQCLAHAEQTGQRGSILLCAKFKRVNIVQCYLCC